MTTPQMSIVHHMTDVFATDPNIIGLFLAGSLGTGSDDSFSDVDFVAVVAEGTDETVAASWRTALENHTTIVHWNQPRTYAGVLLNAIAHDWMRIDLFTTSQAAFQTRTQDNILPLVDPQNLYSLLSESAAPPTPSPAHISHTITEFIRVLGLLHVVLGREEYLTGVWGAGIQRDNIATLLTIKDGLRTSGGALHQSKTMSAHSMEALMALPFPPPKRAALLAAHSTLAAVFFPLAREMADQHGITWPAAFEDATKAILNKHFNGELATDW